MRALRVGGADDGRGLILIPSSPAAAATAVGALLSESADTAEVFISLNEVQASQEALIDAWHRGETPTFIRRRLLLFDLDPVRETGTNSSFDELAAAVAVATRMIGHFTEFGWPEPAVALSGNGIHVLYALELEGSDHDDVYVRTTLSRASQLFNTAQVTVDRVVWDSRRPVRLYGTLNRKGPHTAERPQRWSRLLHCPSEMVAVRLPRLRAFIDGTAPARTDMPSLESLRQKRCLTGEEFVEFFDGVSSTSSGWKVRCPAHPDNDPSLHICETLDGKLLLHCFVGCDNTDILAAIGLEFRQLFGAAASSRPAPRPTHREPHPVNLELEAYAAQCYANATPDIVAVLANALRLPPSSLQWIGVGWDPSRQAWTFPECRYDGRIIGVMLRHLDGTKRCIPGSHRGLILPWGWQQFYGPVFVPEGATDVAALLSIGRLAIGRPSASSVGDLPLLAASLPIEPIILGENDQHLDGSWPGRTGAMRCAEQIAEVLRTEVQIKFPAAGHKDVRDEITFRAWSTASAATVIHQGAIAQKG